MFRKALALSLFVSLVLSGIFFSPAYKAEEEKEFYEDQPYLHYELRIHELDTKHTNEEDSNDFSGSVYMRREYSSEESKNFRELLIKSYKISLLDEEYIQTIGYYSGLLMAVIHNTLYVFPTEASQR